MFGDIAPKVTKNLYYPGALTPGSVLFAGSNSEISQSNSKFFWDNTNNRLYIGANSSTESFQGQTILNILTQQAEFPLNSSALNVYSNQDGYPTLSMVSGQHGNCGIFFDAYTNSSGSYISSYSEANVFIINEGEELVFLSSTGVAPGSTISPVTDLQTMFAVGTNVSAGLPFFGSLPPNGIVITQGEGKPLGSSLSTVTESTSYVPTIGDGTNNFSTSTAAGIYYNLGPMYFVQGQIIWSSKASASAASVVQVSLPVVMGSSAPRITGSVGWANGISYSTNNTLTINSGPNDGYFNLTGLSITGSSNHVSVSQCAASGELQFSIFYWSN